VGGINLAAKAKHIEHQEPRQLLLSNLQAMKESSMNASQEYHYEFPAIREWLDQCPTCWNAEYNEDWEMFCFFICPPEVDSEEYLEHFRVN
jgi:hypothetical protein